VDLRDQSGRIVAPVIAQPKRLALLAYLCVSSPLRFHRRDTLLGLLWPERDDAHARASLRRALYFLRRHLGADVILARGDAVGVNPARVTTDVTAFRTALEAGRPSDALEAYRGDLLEGLFVPSAPEFERWLADERARLRDAAAGAAWTLAARDESDGRVDDAVRWARSAVALASDDEAGIRRLIVLLDRAGDRAAAVQVYEEFAARLLADLALEPAPETQALVDAIRRRAAARAAAPLPSVPDEPQRSVIAVFPFAVRGDAELAYLAEGLVDLLSSKLDGAGELRTVDPHALLGRLDRSGAALDPDAARSIARGFGAGVLLTGSVVATARRLQLRATLHDVVAGGEVRVDVEAPRETEVFTLVDELVRRLLAGRSTSLGGHIGRLGALTSNSLPALKAYLEGERAFRGGRYLDALRAYERGVALDPEFSLGHYRHAAAHAALADFEAARAASAAAWAHRRRLAPQARRLVEAQLARLSGRWDDAERLYLRILTDRPEDVEAWFELGQLRRDFAPYRGRSVQDARGPFERALDLDPSHVAAAANLAVLSALAGRLDAVAHTVETLDHMAPESDAALLTRTVLAFAADDRAAQDRLLQGVRGHRPGAIAAALRAAVVHARSLDAAREFLTAAAGTPFAATLGALPWILCAYLDELTGQTSAEALARAAALDPAAAVEHRAYLATLPSARPSPTLEQLRATLTSPPPGAAATALLEDAAHARLRRLTALYLRGLFAATLGDPDEASSFAEALATYSGDVVNGMGRNLSLGVRARVALDRGDPAEALASLEQLTTGEWFSFAPSSPFYALANERFVRGRALEMLGRREEAEGWMAGLAERSPYELPLRRTALGVRDSEG
jgi:serine/threonine-protein kinase